MNRSESYLHGHLIKSKAAMLLGAAFLLGSMQMAMADTVSITASKDNTLYESPTGTLSNGAGQFLFAGRTAAGNDSLIRRALLAFDLSSLPTSASIDSVTLTMFMSRTISGPQNVSLHRVTSNWGEGISDAGGQEGTGASATPGDATWIHTFSDSNSWGVLGGDFSGVASSNLPIGSIGSYTWDSTPALVNDVQTWLTNPSNNFGWMIVGEEGASGTAKQFFSRENSDAANRPTLTINFTPVPEPSTGFIMGWSVVAVGLLRRKTYSRTMTCSS